MNLFCRLLGHTWVMKADNPKIRWTTDPKTLARLDLEADREPGFYWECARCRERKPVEERAGGGSGERGDPEARRPEAARG
jgi:hypothetical protein